jgi:ElaB/YqjD/DUF883 family membrane-anchored ribosome-binding protein
MSHETDPKTDDASQDAAVQAVETMRKLAEELTRLLKGENGDLAASLKQAGQAASENIGGLAHDAEVLGRAGLDDLGAAVRRNPLAWLAAAAGVGLILGLWNGRGGRR